MYKLVIFDLDGTLLDTAVGVRHSLRETLKELGEKNVSDELVDRFIGPPLMESFQLFLGYDEKKALHGANLFKEYYQKTGVKMANIYPGMKHLLDELIASDKILAVATNKTHENALKILNVFQLDSYFQFIKGNVPNSNSDKASIIRECTDKFRVNRRDTILVGDAIQDELAAQKAGIDFMAVTYGYGFSSKEQKKEVNCVKICDKCSEILEYMNGNNNDKII